MSSCDFVVEDLATAHLDALESHLDTMDPSI